MKCDILLFEIKEGYTNDIELKYVLFKDHMYISLLFYYISKPRR